MKAGWKKKIIDSVPSLQYEEDALMAGRTTFKIGGPADLLVEPANIEEFGNLLNIVQEENIPLCVIGAGSNLLVLDGGIRGLVIVLDSLMSGFKIDATGLIEVAAGTRLIEVARAASAAGLTGLEFASGIPGTVGGALAMNAGAYNGEMSQITEAVQVINSQGQLCWLSNTEMEFDYRQTRLTNGGGWIMAAKLRLSQGDPAVIATTIQTITEARTSKQPLQYPSAGSVFKRPPGHFAGQLIERAGLKGFFIGGAQVSDLHAGFIINTGGATAANVIHLIQHIQVKVSEMFNVHIDPEIRIIGENLISSSEVS